MEDSLVRYPGYLLRRAANATGAELSARLAEIDLRQVDASILLLVEDNAGVTASALGRLLDIQRANMVPVLKRLENADLIERHALDGKSQGLALTATGRSATARARTIIEEFEAELIGRIPPAHRDHLLPALEAIWR